MPVNDFAVGIDDGDLLLGVERRHYVGHIIGKRDEADFIEAVLYRQYSQLVFKFIFCQKFIHKAALHEILRQVELQVVYGIVKVIN